MQNNWTKDEEKYLKENYGLMFATEIAKSLSRSERSVIAKAGRMGLTSSLSSTRNPESTKSLIESKGFVLKDDYKGIHKKHKLICPHCGCEFAARLLHIIHRNQVSCGCVSPSKRKGTENISASYFYQVRRGAISRGIEFEITIEDMDELLVKQEFKCNLSGWEIIAGYTPVKNYTASLDRIESNVGYVKNNIQWLHKMVNLSKQSFEQERFIQMCKAICHHC